MTPHARTTGTLPAQPLRAIAIVHLSFENLGILAPMLDERGYRVSYRQAGVDPFQIGEILDADLLIVLGGPIGVGDADRYPFLVEEQHAIAARLAAGRPTLGICLGAQLMARALDADVRATGGQEIGFAPLQLTEAGMGSPLRHLADVPVLHWHGDQFAIPDGADRLAATPHFPNQAFSLGRCVLGLQFHLEVDHREVERWLIGHSHDLVSAGIDPATIRRDGQEYGPRLASAARATFGEWLEELPTS